MCCLSPPASLPFFSLACMHRYTYLIYITRETMIKSSVRRTEAAIDLIAQGLRCSLVDLFSARQVIHVEERVAEAHVVDRVAVVVSQDLARENWV